MKFGIDIEDKSLSDIIINRLKKDNHCIIDLSYQKEKRIEGQDQKNHCIEAIAAVDMYFSMNISNRESKGTENEIEVYYDSVGTISSITNHIVELCLMSDISSINCKDVNYSFTPPTNETKIVLISVNKKFLDTLDDHIIEKIIDILYELN